MRSDFPEYTDMQRTRIVNRVDALPQRQATPSIGETQLIAKKESLFDGLSVPQIAASAAAAATSMLLASKIGIAGSVIGAAVSSVVTIVATQLYRRMLTMSARKIQATAFETPVPPTQTNPYGLESHGPASPSPARFQEAPARGARIAPTKLQARAAAQRANLQRKITAASIAIAVFAVAGIAALILLGTSGEGLGTRPDPIFSPAPSTQQADKQDTQADAPKTPNDTGHATDPQASDAPAPEAPQPGTESPQAQGDSTESTPNEPPSEGAQSAPQQNTGGTSGTDGNAANQAEPQQPTKPQADKGNRTATTSLAE